PPDSKRSRDFSACKARAGPAPRLALLPSKRRRRADVEATSVDVVVVRFERAARQVRRQCGRIPAGQRRFLVEQVLDAEAQRESLGELKTAQQVEQIVGRSPRDGR